MRQACVNKGLGWMSLKNSVDTQSLFPAKGKQEKGGGGGGGNKIKNNYILSSLAMLKSSPGSRAWRPALIVGEDRRYFDRK